MTTDRPLICVGACNPDYQWLEGQVASYRRQTARVASADHLVMPVPDELALALRRRRHTAHKRVMGETWMCLTCGQTRTG